MLQAIHDKSKGILGIVIVILIGATFALWGIGDYLSGAQEKSAAVVDGMEISQSEFEQGLARQRQRMEQMFEGSLPDSPAFQKQMKEQVLDQLITQRVLLKMIDDEGYRVADQVLAQNIRSMDAFKQDGAFDNKNYQAIVESQGMAVKEFENLYRQDLTVQQLQRAVTSSAIIGEAELVLLNQISQQMRDVNYLQFNIGQFMQTLEVSDAEIADYYEANKARYMHPETVVIDYVELKGADLASDIEVDEEAVRRLYDDYVTSQSSREQRKASHILVATPSEDAAEISSKKAQVESLLERINNGESFADVAKQASEDPGSASNGGDLGWVSKGMMVPAFETALFKLAKGAVSDVVKSEFGFHIIKLDDIRAEAVDSFEDKQDELVSQYKSQKIEDRFYELSELMATTAYENDQSLQEVADAVGLKIQSIDGVSRQQGNGLAMNEKVRKAAFESTVKAEGRNSDIIELASNHAVVLRVSQTTSARQKSLDEVNNIVIASLKSEKARTQAQQAAMQALAKLEAGDSIESLDTDNSVTLVKLGSVKREHQAADPQILSDAFSMQKPADKPVYKVAELATGVAVIQLNAVTLPEQIDQQQLGMLSRQLSDQQANRDMMAVIEYMKSQAEITRDDSL